MIDDGVGPDRSDGAGDRARGASGPTDLADPAVAWHLFVRGCDGCGATDLGSAFGSAARLGTLPRWSCPECGSDQAHWLPINPP